MKTIRRSYDKSFKEMSVDLVESGGKIKKVSQDLDIPEDTLRRWCRESILNKENSFPGKGTPLMTDDQRKIARLEKELRESRLESEMLKKAVSIFSRSDLKSIIL